jgi:uncharacterized protein YecE (DUF72 family)
MAIRIGTVDLPERIERSRYFRELSYLELSALFAGPLKPASLAKWAPAARPGTVLGMVAPWVLSQRQPPRAASLWDHDATVGDFRDGPLTRAALASFHDAIQAVGAELAIFRSPPLFAPSQANRDRLARFFGELATDDAVGAARVWIPDGLWETRAAVKFASELGVTCAFDPLVRAPTEPPEIYYDLEVSALYLRIGGLGRSGPLRNEKLEDLITFLMEYANKPTTIAFESPARWVDARNLRKLLESSTDTPEDSFSEDEP